MFLSWSTSGGTGHGSSDKRSRTRSGCLTCRKRRLKCDEARPVCERCERSKRQCSFDIRLKWEEDARARGICHGRTGIWAKNQDIKAQNLDEPIPTTASESEGEILTYSASQEVLEATFNGQLARLSRYENGSALELDPDERYNPILVEERNADEGNVSAQNVRISILPPPSGLLVPYGLQKKYMHLESTLLSFYVQVLSPSAALLDDSEHNYCRKVFLPMAFSSELTYYGLLMHAAHGLNISKPEFGIVALNLQQLLVRGMQTMLSNGVWDPEEVMVLMVLLCSLNIHQSHGLSWVAQLTGFRDMILQRMRRQEDGRDHSVVYKYCSQYFLSHIILSKTVFSVEESVSKVSSTRAANGASPHGVMLTSQAYPTSSSWTSTEALSLVMQPETLDVIDPSTGLSNTLLLLINEVADLKYDIFAMNTTTSRSSFQQAECSLQSKLHRLKRSVENLVQILPPTITNPNAPFSASLNEHQRSLIIHAEANRLATLLFLNETSLLFKSETSAALPPVLTDLEVGATIEALLSTVDDIITSRPRLTASWPLWALFIAGCCSENEEDRAQVMQLFEAAQRKASFENIAPAQRVVELLWTEKEDTAYPADARDTSVLKMPCYPWERVLARLGWKLSLA